MPSTNSLGHKQEAWLRLQYPAWGQLRDRAIAAGMIRPDASPKPAANSNQTCEGATDATSRPD